LRAEKPSANIRPSRRARKCAAIRRAVPHTMCGSGTSSRSSAGAGCVRRWKGNAQPADQERRQAEGV